MLEMKSMAKVHSRGGFCTFTGFSETIFRGSGIPNINVYQESYFICIPILLIFAIHFVILNKFEMDSVTICGVLNT